MTQVKRNFKVRVESGTIIVGDSKHLNSFEFKDYTNLELIRFMREGRGLIFGTAGDGTFDVQIRLVRAPEPFLSKSEYKLLVGSTDTIIIEIISGSIKIADLHGLSETPHALPIKNGKYKVCGYYFDNKRGFHSFYVALARTTQVSSNGEVTYYVLE